MSVRCQSSYKNNWRKFKSTTDARSEHKDEFPERGFDVPQQIQDFQDDAETLMTT